MGNLFMYLVEVPSPMTGQLFTLLWRLFVHFWSGSTCLSALLCLLSTQTIGSCHHSSLKYGFYSWESRFHVCFDRLVFLSFCQCSLCILFILVQSILFGNYHYRCTQAASPATMSRVSVPKNVFFKWANPGLFFVYFRSFQTNNTIFTTNKCEKCHVHLVNGTGIRTHDLRNMSLLP